MRFSSYNMEGRIKSKTKFINEGVAECFNSVKYNNCLLYTSDAADE